MSSSLTLLFLGSFTHKMSIKLITICKVRPHDQSDAKAMAIGLVSPKHKAQLDRINIAYAPS
jgi:hypothetical protein